MKKLIISILTILCATAGLNAQEKNTSVKHLSYQARIGVGLGYLSQNFSGEENTSAESTWKSSYEIGGSLIYTTNKQRLELETGLYYQRKNGGTKTELTGMGESIQEDFTLHFNYLTIPLHVRYWIAKEKIYVYGGPGIGFCISASQDSSSGNSKLDSDKYKSLGLSLDLGLGFSFAKDFTLGLGTQIGLTKALELRNKSATPHTIMIFSTMRF